MKTILILTTLLVLLIIFPTVVKATPTNNPVFATIQSVQQKIASAIAPLQALLDTLTGRIDFLENKVNQLEVRIAVLESTPTPTPVPSPSVSPSPSFIVSDNTWKYSDSLINGWLGKNFDDSGWLLTNAPSDGLCPPSAINIEGRIDQHGAQPMWTQHPVNQSTAYFRKKFTLATVGKGLIRALFDDDGDIYINGNLVLSSHNGFVEGIQYADVSQYLKVGENVISIIGIDAGGCQSVQFELGMNQLLDDDFQASTLNTNFWELFLNNGEYSLSNGKLHILGGNKPGMPFFREKFNPFPVSGSFSIEFGIQYTSLFPAGDGLALSMGQQPNNSITPDLNIISLWNSNGGDGLSFGYLGNPVLMLGINDLSYHIVKFVYNGDKYLAYLDGILKYTSPSATRASGLWFGHPYYSDLPGWTEFNLDYIRVTQP